MASTMKAVNQHLAAARNELRKACEMWPPDDAGEGDLGPVQEHMRLAGNHLTLLEEMKLEELVKKADPKRHTSKAEAEPSQAKESVG